MLKGFNGRLDLKVACQLVEFYLLSSSLAVSPFILCLILVQCLVSALIVLLCCLRSEVYASFLCINFQIKFIRCRWFLLYRLCKDLQIGRPLKEMLGSTLNIH